MFENSLRQLRLLPVLVIVAMIAFAVRAGDVLIAVNSGAANAQSAAEDGPLTAPAPSQNTLSQAVQNKNGNDKTVTDADIPETPIDEINLTDSFDNELGGPLEYSDIRAELFETLAKRRRELDAREEMIAKKEALLQATEREIERKYKEMSQVRNEIKELLNVQTEEEQKRIMSLVKVYENMKAKDAAQIFNTLDMDILIEVMGRMSERKLSPVLAEMDPDRARSVTIFLAEQKSLPKAPSANGTF